MMETPFIEVAWWNVVDWGITCRERYLTTVILPSFFCCWMRRRKRRRRRRRRRMKRRRRRITTFIISVVFMLLWPKTIAFGAVATGRAKA